MKDDRQGKVDEERQHAKRHRKRHHERQSHRTRGRDDDPSRTVNTAIDALAKQLNENEHPIRVPPAAYTKGRQHPSNFQRMEYKEPEQSTRAEVAATGACLCCLSPCICVDWLLGLACQIVCCPFATCAACAVACCEACDTAE